MKKKITFFITSCILSTWTAHHIFLCCIKTVSKQLAEVYSNLQMRGAGGFDCFHKKCTVNVEWVHKVPAVIYLLKKKVFVFLNEIIIFHIILPGMTYFSKNCFYIQKHLLFTNRCCLMFFFAHYSFVTWPK